MYPKILLTIVVGYFWGAIEKKGGDYMELIGNRAIVIDSHIQGEFHHDALIEFLAKMFIKHEESTKEKASVGAETQNEI
jgi:hypothetical protein